METPDGTVSNLLTELGDHRVFPVSYVKGQAPVSPDEIALSAMNAEELGKNPGDSLTLITGSGTQTMTVCGIYSDITNGGKTAKASFGGFRRYGMGRHLCRTEGSLDALTDCP